MPIFAINTENCGRDARAPREKTIAGGTPALPGKRPLRAGRPRSQGKDHCGRDARAPRDGLVVGDSRSAFGSLFFLGARASRPHFGAWAWSKAFTFARKGSGLSRIRSASALSWKCGRDARAPR